MLIELLISIAIFGVVSVGFLSAMVAGYHGAIVAHEQRSAHTLTRTALEDVRRAQFPITNYETTESNYRVSITAAYIDKAYQPATGSTNLQMVTVTVSSSETGRSILVTEELKVK